MKLKEAKKIAKESGFNFVAADMDGTIYAYANHYIDELDDGWGYSAADNNHKYIGLYTGSKHWTETLREVK